MRTLKGPNIHAKLLHLPRFFMTRKPVYLANLEILTQKLDERPNKMEVLSKIRSEMVRRRVVRALSLKWRQHPGNLSDIDG